MTDPRRRTQPLLAILEVAQAEGMERGDFDEDTRASVRYADPSTWALLGAVRRVLARAGDHEPEKTGLIAVDRWGPQQALGEVQRQREDGRISPLRFVAAFAHSSAGVACIGEGLQGPSLTLTVGPDQSGVALAVAEGWIAEGEAETVVIGTTHLSGKANAARAVAVTSRDGQTGADGLGEEELVDLLSGDQPDG